MDLAFSTPLLAAAVQATAESSVTELAIAFLTLCVLEIVLGIDNIIFISILAGKLPAEQQARARFIGLTLAMIMRVGLLFSISWMAQLVSPLFTIFGNEISGRDLILLVGGLFLVWKSTFEIHGKLKDRKSPMTPAKARQYFPPSSLKSCCSTLCFHWTR